MAGNIQLLDCTLRDGGYINDWNFGYGNLMGICQQAADAGIEIIEIGFLDERRAFDCNRSIMPGTDCVGRIYGGIEKKGALIVGMIDYGACGLEHIKPAGESFLDGIRVIFKKHLRREAMAFCQELRGLGYLVFAQLVSVTSYEDWEIADLAELANEANPYVVSMVDTYGLMHWERLMHYFACLDRRLRPEIGIGYHGHNNLQLGYANCMEFLRQGAAANRRLVVDATLFGMGKAAGNVPIELLAMHLNAVYGKQYGIGCLLEAVEKNIVPFYRKPPWGYDLSYFMAAYHECHPDYVSYLLKKQALSIREADYVLGKLEGERKLLYEEGYIKSLLAAYRKGEGGVG